MLARLLHVTIGFPAHVGEVPWNWPWLPFPNPYQLTVHHLVQWYTIYIAFISLCSGTSGKLVLQCLLYPIIFFWAADNFWHDSYVSQKMAAMYGIICHGFLHSAVMLSEGTNSLQVELKAGNRIADKHASLCKRWRTSNFVIVGGIIWITLL